MVGASGARLGLVAAIAAALDGACAFSTPALALRDGILGRQQVRVDGLNTTHRLCFCVSPTSKPTPETRAHKLLPVHDVQPTISCVPRPQLTSRAAAVIHRPTAQRLCARGLKATAEGGGDPSANKDANIR